MHIGRCTNKTNKQMTTLEKLNNHPAVQNIEIESDFGRKIYWINLNPGFATENGNGQTSGSEYTLAGVKHFLADVGPVNA